MTFTTIKVTKILEFVLFLPCDGVNANCLSKRKSFDDNNETVKIKLNFLATRFLS